MAGKKRTVYLYEPYYIAPKGEFRDAPEGVWTAILDTVGSLQAGDRIKTVSSQSYRGATRSTASPAARFLYIGKRRDPSDWPDHAQDGGDGLPLAIDGELVEPMYLLPMFGTNYVATLRTSAGPRHSAAASWINQVIAPAEGMELCLRPVVRHDALARLVAADQVAAVSVQIDEFTELPDDSGTFTDAIKEMQAAGGSDATITITMSYGYKTADEPTSRSVISGLTNLVGRSGLRKASARVGERKEDGKIKKEDLDFFNDAIAQQVAVGTSTKEAPTPEIVMTAMHKALDHFRTNLEVIREGGVSDVEDNEDEQFENREHDAGVSPSTD